MIGSFLVLFKFCNTNDDKDKDTELIPPELIGKIAFAETDVSGITTVIYLVDSNKPLIVSIGIKELYKKVSEYSYCFIYSKGHEDKPSFIFSIQHVRKCEIIRDKEEKYNRKIELEGGWQQIINKDTAGKLIKIMMLYDECKPEVCGERCCKPPKKD